MLPCVHGYARWKRSGRRYPLWVDEPKSVHERGYFPLRLLQPGETGKEIQEWCDSAAEMDLEKSRQIESPIRNLRDQILTFNMPYLVLPSDTPPDIAIDVFIKMNTSSVKLTAFDIIVARFENETKQSLHQLVQDLVTPDYSSRKHKMSKRARHVESDQRVTGYPQKTAETRPG